VQLAEPKPGATRPSPNYADVYGQVPGQGSDFKVGSRARFQNIKTKWNRAPLDQRGRRPKVSYPWEGKYMEAGCVVPTHFWVAVCDPKLKESVGYLFKNFMYTPNDLVNSVRNPGFGYQGNGRADPMSLKKLAEHLGTPEKISAGHFFPSDLCNTTVASDFLNR
jgi:hypothetical protein